MRTLRRGGLISFAVLLAACSGAEAPKPAAEPALAVAEATPAGPVAPDFDATRNAFYRECMQSQHNVKECTCTTQTLKDGVDADTYRAMFTGGMSAVIPFKGDVSKAVNAALSKALKECRGK